MATSSSSDGLRHRERASGEAKELQNPPEQGDGGDEPALNHTNDKSRRGGPDRPCHSHTESLFLLEERLPKLQGSPQRLHPATGAVKFTQCGLKPLQVWDTGKPQAVVDLHLQ
ncbi:hypothetical protein GBAR_LOCUS13021 [Geodia barretti]|uniref:Uncharacterized protein n=1 Tax=Geodia barretti TaxID=519541 RepID=A0AA35WMB7_GEOBA|nr:hypothetical protein GBAR_LOCUS13021 [Geodia barretti]